MWSYNINDKLYHHGILGMHWGHKRHSVKTSTIQKNGEKTVPKEDKTKNHNKVDKGSSYAKKMLTSGLGTIAISRLSGSLLISSGHVEVGAILSKVGTIAGLASMVGSTIEKVKKK
jgi:hypothetical protein